MRIDPVIAELRRDPTPQLLAQARLEAVRDRWRAAPRLTAVLDELDAYGTMAPFGDCPALAAALNDCPSAQAIIDALLSPMMQALRKNPLGHVPLRHQHAPGIAVLQLAASGRAALSLICYEALYGAETRAETVCFAGGERHELCLAGAADARFFEVLEEERQGAVLGWETRRIAAGDRLAFRGARHTKIVDRPIGRLVMLRLSRSEESPVAAREYRIADGALVHCASGDRSESRDEMAAAVLGAMGRGDAAPVLADMARSAGLSDHLRWQALCQTLALDTAQGFDTLDKIACHQSDTLTAHACALRARLVERHPELDRWTMSCRVS